MAKSVHLNRKIYIWILNFTSLWLQACFLLCEKTNNQKILNIFVLKSAVNIQLLIAGSNLCFFSRVVAILLTFKSEMARHDHRT